MRRVGSIDIWFIVFDGFVRGGVSYLIFVDIKLEGWVLLWDREFVKVVVNYFRFDFYLVEFFVGVDIDDVVDYFGNNNYVMEVSFDEIGFFVGFSFLFGFVEFFDEVYGVVFKIMVDFFVGMSVDDIVEFVGG